jgi:hypothetical protein
LREFFVVQNACIVELRELYELTVEVGPTGGRGGRRGGLCRLLCLHLLNLLLLHRIFLFELFHLCLLVCRISLCLLLRVLVRVFLVLMVSDCTGGPCNYGCAYRKASHTAHGGASSHYHNLASLKLLAVRAKRAASKLDDLHRL